MKTQLKKIADKINFWNIFIGIAIGIGVGVYTLIAFVPNANELIRIYRLDRESRMEDRDSAHGSHNAYMMGDVTSERQFVEEMIKHHEAAVHMSEQVLALDPREELRKLAHDIILAQTTEIKMMKDWLATWK